MTRIKTRHAKGLLVIRSQVASGRATSPIGAASPGCTSNSGRTGAAGGWRPSAMGHPLHLPAALGEQHGVDALLERLERDPLLHRVVEGVGVDLRLDLTRMGREHEDARTDNDRLLDRVGDKKPRELRVL